MKQLQRHQFTFLTVSVRKCSIAQKKNSSSCDKIIYYFFIERKAVSVPQSTQPTKYHQTIFYSLLSELVVSASGVILNEEMDYINNSTTTQRRESGEAVHSFQLAAEKAKNNKFVSSYR
jgi:hypothetical protein